MTTMGLSHICYKTIINGIATITFGTALFATVFAVYGVTDSKLRNLKLENALQMEQLQKADAAKAYQQKVMAERAIQLDCLAKNIYWEAAGESFEGKVAVAQVTLNRLESGRYGETICQVVFQRTTVYKNVICQFSWTCTAKSRIPPRNPRLFKDSQEIAKKVYIENYRLPHLTKAMYFHNTTVRPGWNKTKITQIGQHIFYRD